MTPSPVVAPDRSGGRIVETNVAHKMGDDARVDDAARNAAGLVDDNARSHVNFSLRNRASASTVMPT
jgi:hypothetical protein